MSLAYPLLQFLVYLSLLLAPPETDRIFIDGLGLATELRRDGANWTMTQNGQSSTVSLADDTLVTLRDGQEERCSLAEYVGPVLRHDWTASPKLPLRDATILEKTTSGYLLRTDVGTPKMKNHVIQFAKPGEIRVHVINSVNNPGAYILPAGATLLDAIAAAGGFNRMALRNRVKLHRASVGEKTEPTTVDTDKMRQEKIDPPALQDGDIVSVPERFC